MTPLFQLEGVTHYYGQVCALSDISLTVPPGAMGLVGQNGAGKSTLMQILLGLIRPTRGIARVLGEDVRTGGIRLRGRIGYMPERESLIPGLNGIEYAALAGELSGLSRKQALRRAHEMLSYLEMDEARYRKMEQYSPGMKQRLKLAATLVHDPDVLLLDEPTAGLDPGGREAMLSLMETLAARPQKSLILSSHLLGDIERVCKSAVVLDRGKVVGEGKIEELRSVRRRHCTIRWHGNENGFAAALTASGVEVARKCGPNEATVILPEGWSPRNFFTLAKEHGTVVTGLLPEEENFEAIYHRLIGGKKPQEG